MKMISFKFKNAQSAVDFLNVNNAAKDVQTISVGWKYTHVFLVVSEQRFKALATTYNLGVADET